MPGSEPTQVTRLLVAIGSGEQQAAEELLPLVYDELRNLAHAQMAREKEQQTLQPTALVHEAYLRLVGGDVQWNNRRHFFGAAARAMRRILVESARRRKQLKRGGGRERVDLMETPVTIEPENEELVELDEALEMLEARDARKAEVVMLRYFAGLTVEQTALAMDLSPATVKNEWAYARAWLYRHMNPEGKVGPRREG